MSDFDTTRIVESLEYFGLISPPAAYRQGAQSYRSSGAPLNRYPFRGSNFDLPIHAASVPASTGVSRRNSRRQASTSSRRAQQAPPPLRRRMTGMLDIDRSYNRRGERTFAGGRCAVCEEPLEHTLRGERFLQLTCSHVSHEACFYHYIRDGDAQGCPECGAFLGLDPGRGGNVVNLDKLSQIVRSLQPHPPPYQDAQPPRSPHPWDSRSTDYRDYAPQQRSRQGHTQSHTRETSNGTVRTVTASDIAGSTIPGRRHDHGNSVDTDVPTTTTRSSFPRNPIPAPFVSLRSEYPTMTRSKQAQSLTCLVTVEVFDSNIRPHYGQQHTLQNAASTISEPLPESRPPTPPKEIEEDNKTEWAQEMESIAAGLHSRVDNWHGLDFSRFGPLRLHNKLQVGKDARSWQELECYLFTEMLICVKEKKVAEHVAWDDDSPVPRRTKATLKGSIMIKKHLESVETSSDNDHRLSLNLSVPELPLFHLQFSDEKQLNMWERALSTVHVPYTNGDHDSFDADGPLDEEDDDEDKETVQRDMSSVASTYGAGKSTTAVAPDTSEYAEPSSHLGPSLHAPIDLVLVIPVSSSMAGIKIDNLKDTIRFLLRSLGHRDRLGLVTVGASNGASTIAGLTTKAWPAWSKILDSLKATTHKASGKDLVEGANAAMDVLMQRKTVNPISSVFIVSDSSVSEADTVDFVVQRAEAAKVTIYTFGLGLAHKPDAMVELSTKTEASYTYLKDWHMLRECLAGCLGALQTTSHQSVKLKLRLPEGAAVKFAKISGALQVVKRAGGRDVECSLGDLRYGDKRDILVTLTIAPESTQADAEAPPQDAWDSMISNLEALGGSIDQDSTRVPSIEELPVLQADLVYGDLLHNGATTQSPRQSLLAITMLAAASKYRPSRPQSVIPPHTSIVQRRMEMLISDMLGKALLFASNGQPENAQKVLLTTRSVLKGWGKAGQPNGLGPPTGGLPPIPSSRAGSRPPPSPSPNATPTNDEIPQKSPITAIPASPHPLMPTMTGVDFEILTALDAEVEAALEWITHSSVFARDARKGVLQAIGVISSQRAYTHRTAVERIWSDRISGVRDMAAKAREWRKDEAVDAA